MAPVIIAAIIGGASTIGAAVIGTAFGKRTGYGDGHRDGMKRGFEEGRQHSMLRYMDVQQEQLERATDAIRRNDPKALLAIAQALVDNALLWRQIQQNFSAMLNGRIDDLAGILKSPTPQSDTVQRVVSALNEGYKARRLAVEVELEKSKI